MSFSSGLTSLRESPLPSLLPQILSPSEVDGRRLAEVRAEIQRFYKMRDDLREETKKLTLQIAKQKDTAKSDTEVKRLKIQKGILITQIKELVTLLEKLTGKKIDLVSSLDAYGEERTSDLVDISRRIAGELGEVSGEMARKSEKLGTQEALLTEMAEYYARLAELSESSASSNAQKGLELNKRSTDATQKEESLTIREKKAQKLTQEADRKHQEADDRLSGIDKISGWFESQADGERAGLERIKRQNNRDKKEIRAERKGILEQRDMLKRREKRIADKEATLVRSYAEVQAKAKKLGIVI